MRCCKRDEEELKCLSKVFITRQSSGSSSTIWLCSLVLLFSSFNLVSGELGFDDRWIGLAAADPKLDLYPV